MSAGDSIIQAFINFAKREAELEAEITRLRSGAYAAGVEDAAALCDAMALELDRQQSGTDPRTNLYGRLAGQELTALTLARRIRALAPKPHPVCQNAYGVCDQNPPCVGVCKTVAANGGNDG